jgi:hypothetical protein
VKMMSRERRSSPRVPFDEDVIVYAAGRRMACRGLDLSTGGIGLLPSEEARPGLHVIVDMGLEGNESIAVEGYVVRQQQMNQNYAWGVQFHGLSPRVQHKLDAHVAHVARRCVPHNTQPALGQIKRRRPELPELPERVPTPSAVALPSAPPRRTPTSTEQRRIVGPTLEPTPTPSPAPAFEVPSAQPMVMAEPVAANQQRGPVDPRTRAAPSPAFFFAPPPVAALPRPPQPVTHDLPPRPRPSSIPSREPDTPAPEPRISVNEASPVTLEAELPPPPPLQPQQGRRRRRQSPARGGAAVLMTPRELGVHERETACYPRHDEPNAGHEVSDDDLAAFVQSFLDD